VTIYTADRANRTNTVAILPIVEGGKTVSTPTNVIFKDEIRLGKTPLRLIIDLMVGNLHDDWTAMEQLGIFDLQTRQRIDTLGVSVRTHRHSHSRSGFGCGRRGRRRGSAGLNFVSGLGENSSDCASYGCFFSISQRWRRRGNTSTH